MSLGTRPAQLPLLRANLRHNLHPRAGLLPHLAHRRHLGRLTRVDCAAGDIPVALAQPGQQHLLSHEHEAEPHWRR